MATVSLMRAAIPAKRRRPASRSVASPARSRTSTGGRGPTTISLYSDTKEFLRVLGRSGETYEIIRRLIRYAPIKEQDKVWNHISKAQMFVPLDEL